jgi:hypothetical protein
LTQELFLYRPHLPTSERVVEILGESKLWFSTPNAFNDPFEARPHINTPDDARPNYEELERLAKKFWPGATDAERRAEVDRRHALYEKPEHRAEYRRQIAEALHADFQRTSIACFAESPADIRMWSYYATGHSGYCLGFVFDPPWIYVDSARRRYKMVPEKVHYSDTYPSVDSEADFREDAESANLARNALLTKARGWESEQEWRCFRPSTPSGHQTFPPTALKTLILGARTPPARRNELVELARSRASRLEIFQAEIATDKFELLLSRVP